MNEDLKIEGYPIVGFNSNLRNTIVPIYKYNKDALNPEKINNNTYKFFSDFDYELIPERKNYIKSGFLLNNLYSYIIPSEFHKGYDRIIVTGKQIGRAHV